MIAIIDNGSQYTHLIKRNCRDLGFESEIINDKGKLEFEPKKVIISGGPNSVYTSKIKLSREIAEKILKKELDVPLLGICFGHQLIAHLSGAKVEKGKSAEYGISEIIVSKEDLILKGIPKKFNAWVSHYDEIKELPKDFEILAHSEICKIEAMRHKKRNIFTVQFHPEVWHTEHGERILENFLKI